MARLHNGPKSWINSIQKTVNSYLAQWNIDGTLIVSLGTYAFAGFVTGFLLKKIGNLLTLSILLIIALSLVSSYFGLITIHLPKIQNILGIPMPHSFQEAVEQFILWGRTHTLEVFAALIGTWLGYKIG